MSEKEKFLIIKKYIDEMDYYDLLAGGAPSDEFDNESMGICAKVRLDHSVRDIADIIALVFNAAFDANDGSVMFIPVAELIKNELLS